LLEIAAPDIADALSGYAASTVSCSAVAFGGLISGFHGNRNPTAANAADESTNDSGLSPTDGRMRAK
jgi:hypothetical protein